MLELDEWDELLTNGFATLPHREGHHSNDPTHGHDNVDDAGYLEVPSSHPLRSPSAAVSYAAKDLGEIQTGMDATRPRLTHLTRTLSENDLDCPATVEAANTPDNPDTLNRHDSDDILHTVFPSDSLAAVALRYGVSLAALRHANQLWPSDPIHLRSQLIIPRHRARPAKRRVVSQPTTSSINPETPIVSSSPSTSTGSLSSTLFAARDTVLSALPARISIDSVSSRVSANEELELENFLKPRLQSRTSDMDYLDTSVPLGVELDTLSRSQRNYIPAHNITSLLDHDAPPISCQQLRNLTSDPTIRPSTSAGVQTSRHSTPAPVFVPVRISQLEPEPAMELPALIKHGRCEYLWVSENVYVNLPVIRQSPAALSLNLTPDFAIMLEVGEPTKSRVSVVTFQMQSYLSDNTIIISACFLLLNLQRGEPRESQGPQPADINHAGLLTGKKLILVMFQQVTVGHRVNSPGVGALNADGCAHGAFRTVFLAIGNSSRNLEIITRGTFRGELRSRDEYLVHAYPGIPYRDTRQLVQCAPLRQEDQVSQLQSTPPSTGRFMASAGFG
ncbi:uncharacterized protein EDB91DRAFT_1087124 [Suillus paluster]|uniref:uncharacterized protein n=1 Tax=Suillus paluster TaxID=48578 RepID=UPI001B87887B|nr:uncharacterized protein EDB91DRAFT_1087124 [Suillus paluster]KAG1725410.1 hypothetical protein EDB91DRAFT_1087124 [Suillus paluster]